MKGRYEGLSDEEMARLCAGELPYVTYAFEELLKRYEPVVLRTCQRYLGDLQEAEEACQDVFLRVFNKISQFEERSSFRTWLYRIVLNVCSNRQQKLQRRSRHEFAGAVVREGFSFNGRVVTNSSVGYALDQLAPADKEILLLRFDEDLTLEEIADVMGLGLSAAKMRLYRSMQRFRRIYTDSLHKPVRNSG
jgi:RNA polymerase sigma-70 factor (ECF subfamily)